MRRGARCVALLVGDLLLLSAASVSASDLSYTFLEFGSVATRADFAAAQTAGLQTVSLAPDDGDGLAIRGSLAIGNRFYLAGSWLATVVDTAATIESPIATTVVSGSFDWTETRAGFGGVLPIGETLDFVAELSHHAVNFDFGSFAGENFDSSDSGVALAAGLRFNPRPQLELSILALSSAVGEVNLSTGELAAGSAVSAAVRWYVFEDIGLGLEIRDGDDGMSWLSASIRFGFGELRAGD